MRELIFVDTETGGLDAEVDPLVELTWATIDGEPHTLWFGVESVKPFIDNLIKFTDRHLAGVQSDHFEVEAFLKASHDNTMVAANPAFDKSFLVINGLWQFHYRMLDIESYAMKALGLYYVPGMKDVYDALTSMGHSITEPDHTSRNDVLAMRDAFKVLREL